MSAVGFTEAIWHFAGYLHIADALARSTEIYDGEAPPRDPEDPLLAWSDHSPRPEFEDPAGRPVPLTEPVFSDPPHHGARVAIPETAMPKLASIANPLPFVKPPHAPEPALAHQSSLVIQTRLNREITVEYENGGNDTLIAIKQLNQMDDRDTLVVDGVRAADGSIVIPVAVDTAPLVEAMVQQALAETPDTLPVVATGNTEALIDAVQQRDAVWRAEGQSPEAAATATAPVGRIVDGVASDAPLPVIDPFDTVPWHTPAAAPATSAESRIDGPAPAQGVGTLAETGQNTQINAAVIVDLTEASGSLVVGGDYFFSRGIVQVNVLIDSDHVDIARPDGSNPLVATGGNEVHNVAEFVTNTITFEHQGATGTPRWHVDVFKGDFYDVKTVVQFNGLDDNDRTVQTTENTLFDVKTGGNEQANLAEVRGIDSYDIIIVLGNFHRADWIFQYNIVLDVDVAKLLSAADTGGDGAEVSTGFNRLVNDASITTYDSETFKPLNDAHRSLLEGLDQQVTVLTPNADWKLSGNISGTLKILYVDGDYYDINTITQVNVLSDVDQSLQASDTDDSRQGISSGGNVALNEARILDPGTLSTSKYIGGDVYEESILVQTNIITDNDTVVIHDTTTLVPEFVAFADDSDHEHNAAPDPRPADTSLTHDHVMSQMLS